MTDRALTSSIATDGVRRLVTPARVTAIRGDRHLELPDDVITEEPMEIRLAGPSRPAARIATTMRTPGHDFDLAVGFLVSEGLVRGEDVRSVRYCDLQAGDPQRFNVVTVEVATDPETDLEARQPISTSHPGSEPGGRAASGIELRRRACDPLPPGPVVAASTLLGLPMALRSSQRIFDRTGGLHAAGLADSDGRLLVTREDVGRHNAVDKVVGHAALAGELPLTERLLAVSGRVSFEIVRKAAVAGIPVVVAVSAPTSLAIETADDLGITLVGFVRDERANVYTGAERVDLDA